jgi:membrane-bound serine protease (ClpP class)
MHKTAAWAAVGLLFGGGLLLTSAAAPAQGRSAAWVVLEGAIGPASSHYVVRALDDAAHEQRALVILQLDTPGGLDSAMREIIKAILASPVPVVAYVAPDGARAASAGTYILYATHLAAMAPATNLGAATPVAIGAEGQTQRQTQPESGSTMDRKSINDAVSYIRALAQLRGRNADWAETAVRTAASLSANEALQQHVIEIIARDVPDLLRQADGRKLMVGGRELVLDTRDLTVQRIDADWRTRLLSVLTHPTIAYGLLLVGIYGLLLEGYNPGAILPGVAGAIALLVALYAFELLSVSFAGLGLLVLGVGLMITEFFVPAFGSLVIGGLIAFVVGSLMLFDTSVPGAALATPLIAGLGLAGGAVAAAIIVLAARARRRPVSTGVEAMIGAAAEAVADFSAQGTVRYGGELWSARTSAPLRAGQRVRITRVDNLVLWVEPLP